MPDNKKITELPDATLPIATGVKFEAVQGGINVKVDADDMPGSGGGAWGSITGTLSDQTDLNTALGLKQPLIPRVQTVVSAATVTPNLDTDDVIIITAQAAGLTIANPTGTKREGYPFMIRIKDNGTARAISFGTEYRQMEVTLPTTTVISKYLYLQCVVNVTDTKIDVVSVVNEI